MIEVATAIAGLKEFEGSTFDLAIVDIFLQGANGLDVIRKMREHTPGFPIVAISGITALDFVSHRPSCSMSYVCKSRFARPNWSARSNPQPAPGLRLPRRP